MILGSCGLKLNSPLLWPLVKVSQGGTKPPRGWREEVHLAVSIWSPTSYLQGSVLMTLSKLILLKGPTSKHYVIMLFSSLSTINIWLVWVQGPHHLQIIAVRHGLDFHKDHTIVVIMNFFQKALMPNYPYFCEVTFDMSVSVLLTGYTHFKVSHQSSTWESLLRVKLQPLWMFIFCAHNDL